MNETLNEELEESTVIKRRYKKGAVTFHIKLTEEQKAAKALALENIVTVFTGKPGTSKSTMICNIALDLLIKGDVGKIIVTRPAVEVGRTQGYLPGDVFDFKEGKMAPYLAPLLQAMYKLRSQNDIDNMIKKGLIEIVPVNFVRGRNFEDCVVIVDEAQNLTFDELKALTTRICKDSKMLFTSDLNQVDLINKNITAGKFFKCLTGLKGFATFELTENFRHPLAIQIMDRLDEMAEKGEKF